MKKNLIACLFAAITAIAYGVDYNFLPKEYGILPPGNPFTVSSTLAVNPEDLQIVKHDVKQRMCYYPSGLPINIYEGDALTDRMHLGKPWLNLDGVGLYNNSARLHDAIAGSFITPDPLAHKYTSLSPFSNTPGNPVNLADYDGKEISGVRDIDANKLI